MNILGGISRTEFLTDYWQKKPLLIRQAFPDYQSPISPDELAGLACEEDIQSRLVLEHGKDGPWELRHGPFDEEDFAVLPDSHWTLLVQAVDHHLPQFTQLLDEFDFIPNWRIDDVMVSYAPLHGSVGPHLDSYDVFLLQSHGRRHWHINQDSYTENDFIDGLELRILAEFESQQDWILEPGDMLYLPPGVAHHGIALDDCLTTSIGFRAPSQKELLSAYTHGYDDLATPRYYTDPNLAAQEATGEISAEQIQAVRQLLVSAIADETTFASWFGRFITENPLEGSEQDTQELSRDEFNQRLQKHDCLNRPGNIRMSYIDDKDWIRFFYAGNVQTLPASQRGLLRYLCANHRIAYPTLLEQTDEETGLNLLYDLYQTGCFFFDE